MHHPHVDKTITITRENIGKQDNHIKLTNKKNNHNFNLGVGTTPNLKQ